VSGPVNLPLDFSEITPLLVVSFINNRLESKTVRKMTLEGGERVHKRPGARAR
jgi:hypothetical protein